MNHFLRAAAFALALLCSTPSAQAGQQFTYFCDCDSGLGPCGTGVTTNVPGGCLNSLGAKAFLFPGSGSMSVAADDLELISGNLPQFQFGLAFMGSGTTQIPMGDGLRCVAAGGGGLFRFPVQNSGDAGVISVGPGIVAYSSSHFAPAGHIQAGQRWNMQVLYRDALGPCGSGFNLTNALALDFTP